MFCSEIIGVMNKIAPEEFALDWDNVGLITGDPNQIINKIIIGLDLTDNLIDQAIKLKANMIIAHHPIFLEPIKKINYDSKENRRVVRLMKNSICLYVAHTNLDIADHGTNFSLCKMLELDNVDSFDDLNYGSMGRTGYLKNSLSLEDLAFELKNNLGLEKINFYGDKNKIIKKVALCTGSGSSKKYFLLAKKKSCDVYLTGDIKYHDVLLAHDLDLNLIDITHYASEKIFAGELKSELKNYINMEVVCEKNALDYFCVI